jgi:hypothetical protein
MQKKTFFFEKSFLGQHNLIIVGHTCLYFFYFAQFGGNN